MSSKKGILEPLRVRVRRFQFILGMGFVALVMGQMLTVALALRLSVRVQSLPLESLRLLLGVVLENLWVLGVLPLLCYGAARAIELRPWTTGAGAAASGSVFTLALDFVRSGTDGLWQGGLLSMLNVAAFAVGVVLSARAVTWGRAAASQQSEKAQEKAQERKSEYDEFLRAAEQGAARLEQREAAAQAPAPQATEAPPAAEAAQVVSLPEPPAPSEPEPAAPPDVPKTPAA
ncbi:MAG TPA: hypothetical protein VE153_34450 [Myxococcus sp.]|nr:hypothetical protein [Myxococcus sp.]